MKRSVRQTGVLRRLLFLKCRTWELAIGGSKLASLWCSLLKISLNNLIDNYSGLSESVEFSRNDYLHSAPLNTFGIIRQILRETTME